MRTPSHINLALKHDIAYHVEMQNIERTDLQSIIDANIRNHTILLDVDGVLLADIEEELTPHMLRFVASINKHNDVWIVSNSFCRARIEIVADALNIPWIETKYKKPNSRILEHIDRDPNKPLLVIGDKYLTDGLFAKNIGARALLMKVRLTNKGDRWLIKITYWLDDLIAKLLGV